MATRVNEKKLPIKYLLEVYQELPGFPTHSDLEYYLVRYLEERDHLDKPFKPEQLWFGFKNYLGTIEDLRGFLEYLSNPDDPTDRSNFNVQLKKTLDSLYIMESHSWE
jgi:hypothetical protein